MKVITPQGRAGCEAFSPAILRTDDATERNSDFILASVQHEREFHDMNKTINLVRSFAGGAAIVAVVSFHVAGASTASAATNRHSVLGSIGGAVGAAGRAAGGLGGVVIGRTLGGSKKPIDVSNRRTDRLPPAAAPPSTRDHRRPPATNVVRDHRTQPIVRDHRSR
ncbi:hypothetical protein ONR75_13185 [Rhodopseudomonas sp. P2A-2r]|uniref:hypothetical protein n=1 Tax=Rhodopseudomonas sp. P2A-2r TaxID=2991972 RepID=UPI002234405B|nr:hypothetical protein [Rhodopseudomonas sp. P2A-2r]UZE51471.1 hypothetical protein ONR75_13185 [Rhodopseudomonas sp. P2A-2r]